MKRYAVVYALCLFQLVQFQDTFSNGLKVDSVVDTLQFRTPYSLNECLHDGLVTVEAVLQDLIAYNNDLLPCLESNNQILQDLQDQFDLMIDQSNVHMVHRGDRDYLQSMIDRIDKMIQALESSCDLSDQELDATKRSAETLRGLSDKLSA